jgi:hypothetical protein
MTRAPPIVLGPVGKIPLSKRSFSCVDSIIKICSNLLMAEYKFYLKQPPVSELVDKLLSVIEEVSPNCSINGFSIGTNAGHINYLPNNQARKIADFKNRNDNNGQLSFLSSRPYLDISTLSLNTTDEYNFSIAKDKGFYLKLTTSGQRESDSQRIAPITDSLQKHFNLLRQQEVIDSALPEAEREALQVSRTILLDFSSQAAKLSQLSADNTEKMNHIIIEKTNALDQRYEKKNTDLDEAHRRRTKELDDEREAFTKDKAKFDARENTVVRRDLLGKIQTIVENQKKIEITTDTLAKRKPVGNICLFLFVLASVLMAVFGYKVFTETSPSWFHVAPFTTGVLLFVSTAIFFIRWNDQWFKEHANAEFENRQFSRDIVRASWLAELLFEWKEKKEVPFPDALITSYTTGLFRDNDVVKTTKHPFDDLKSLAGSVSEIKFSEKGGISFKKKSESE